MGYTTTFKGELKFNNELSAKQLAKVKSFFGEDVREHPDWNAEGSYIDLKFNDDFTAIVWDDETEKNSGMVSHVNLIIEELQKEFPDFGLSGHFMAQGEDMEDRWVLKIEDGKAVQVEIKVQGERVTCPHCDESFIIETLG